MRAGAMYRSLRDSGHDRRGVIYLNAALLPGGKGERGRGGFSVDGVVLYATVILLSTSEEATNLRMFGNEHPRSLAAVSVLSHRS